MAPPETPPAAEAREDAPPVAHAPGKDAIRAQWDRAAAGWDAQAPRLRAWLAGPTAAMIAQAGIGPGARVLDVAAGAGEQTLDIARAVGPGGSVLATDLSPAILERAAMRARAAGLDNVRTRLADGEALGLEEASFDAAVCRLGLMLLPDPLSGLREVRRALRPGGRFCAVVFAGPANNPCITLLVSTAMRHAGLPPRDPFQAGGLLSLGKPGLIEALFAGAGFAEIRVSRMEAPFRLPSVRDYLDFLRAAAGPVIAMLDRLDPAAREAAWADIEGGLGAFRTEGGWEGPNELLLASGRR